MKFLIPLVLVGCAQAPMQEVKKDLVHGNISLNGVLNLSRTSFIKGCLFGIQTHYFERTGGKKLEYCKQASRAHEEEMKILLK